MEMKKWLIGLFLGPGVWTRARVGTWVGCRLGVRVRCRVRRWIGCRVWVWLGIWVRFRGWVRSRFWFRIRIRCRVWGWIRWRIRVRWMRVWVWSRIRVGIRIRGWIRTWWIRIRVRIGDHFLVLPIHSTQKHPYKYTYPQSPNREHARYESKLQSVGILRSVTG